MSHSEFSLTLVTDQVKESERPHYYRLESNATIRPNQLAEARRRTNLSAEQRLTLQIGGKGARSQVYIEPPLPEETAILLARHLAPGIGAACINFERQFSDETRMPAAEPIDLTRS